MLLFWFRNFIAYSTIGMIFISNSSSADAELKNPTKIFANSNSSPSAKLKLSSNNKWKTLDGKEPLIIAHRGEKVFAPEHTLYGYALASILGADYIEPDLCLTKDNQLVCHHDVFLEEVTSDVGDHPEFASLRKQLPNGNYAWNIRDFTLEQIKTLKLRQKPLVGIRPLDLNGVFAIPTFQEFINRIHEISFKLNRTIGIIPELKAPSYHNQNQTPHFMEDLLLTSLETNGYAVTNKTLENCRVSLGPLGSSSSIKIKCPPVIIQSFELPPLEYLKTKTTIDLVMLVFSDAQQLTHKGLHRISQSAKYYSIWKGFLQVEAPLLFQSYKVPINTSEIEQLGGFIQPREFPSAAHAHGLKLVVYTVYDSREPSLLGCSKPPCAPVSKAEELNYYFDLGVDGIFVENVAESVQIRTIRMMADLSIHNKSGCRGLGGGDYSVIMLASGLLAILSLKF